MNRLVGWLRVLAATVALDLANQFRYPLEWITSTIGAIVLFSGVMLGLKLTMGAGAADATGMALLLTPIAMAGLQGPVKFLDTKAGELEEVFLSPMPTAALLFCHATAALVTALVNILVSFLVIAAFFHLELGELLSILRAVPPAFLGSLGLGYTLAAAQLLFKRLGGLVNLVSLLLLAMAFAPAGWLRHVSWLSPYASGLMAVRGVQGGVLAATALSVVELGLGLVVLRIAERTMVARGWAGVR